MPELGVGFLYVDVTFDDGMGLFVAQCRGHEGADADGEVALSSTLDGLREAVMRWAEQWRVDLPIRFRYSDRAKLAMG